MRHSFVIESFLKNTQTKDIKINLFLKSDESMQKFAAENIFKIKFDDYS